MRLRIGLAFAAFIMIGANDAALGVLLPSIGSFYAVDKATVSLLFLFGTAGYLIAAFSSGPLVEKLGTRRFLVLGVGVFLLGAALLAAMLPFPLALASILVLDIGIGVIDAGLNSYIAGLPENNTSRLNYLHAFYGLGALIGPVVASGFLAVSLEWNSVYILWVCFSGLLVIGMWAGFRHGEAAPHEGAAKQGGSGNVLAAALRLRTVWIAALFLAFYVGGEVSLGNWGYSLLTEERRQAPLLSAWAVSGFWLGLTLGRLVLGRLSARLGDKAMIQWCLVGVVAGLVLVWPSWEVSAALGLFLTGFSLGPIYPTTIAAMSRMVAPRLLPSAIGFVASAGSMGAAFFPWIAGNLAQHLGLWTLLPYVMLLAGLMLVCWWFLQRQRGIRTED